MTTIQLKLAPVNTRLDPSASPQDEPNGFVASWFYKHQALFILMHLSFSSKQIVQVQR
jgi:hypothetical protein